MEQIPITTGSRMLEDTSRLIGLYRRKLQSPSRRPCAMPQHLKLVPRIQTQTSQSRYQGKGTIIKRGKRTYIDMESTRPNVGYGFGSAEDT